MFDPKCLVNCMTGLYIAVGRDYCDQSSACASIVDIEAEAAYITPTKDRELIALRHFSGRTE